jgi:hypothetical protein
MTTKPVAASSSIEGGKRILRTVLFVALGIVSAIPYLVTGVHFNSGVVTGILAQVGAVATALNGLALTPWGQRTLALIGLDASAVQTADSDGASIGEASVTTVKNAAPIAATAIDDVRSGKISDAVSAAAASTPGVAGDVSAVVADVKTAASDVAKE